MLYSSNRVHHLYVVNKVAEKSDLEGTAQKHLKETAAVGTIHPRKTLEGELYFEYASPGGVITTDRVNPARLLSKGVTKGTKCSRRLASKVISFKDFKKAGNNTAGTLKSQSVAGQTLSITLELGGYLCIDEMAKRICQASVYMSSSDETNSDIYARLAHNLAMNVASLPDPMIRIILLTGDNDSDGDEIKISNTRVRTKLDTLLGKDYKGILIRERVDEDYVRGKGEEIPLTISVTSKRITYNEHEVVWLEIRDAEVDTTKVYGKVTADKAELMPNGRRTCDLEYWCMGERGDQERHFAWPNNVDTKYLADPTKVYDYLNMHFYWEGSHEEVQKSERDMTLVASDDGSNTIMKSIITAINNVGVVTFTTLT